MAPLFDIPKPEILYMRIVQDESFMRELEQMKDVGERINAAFEYGRSAGLNVEMQEIKEYLARSSGGELSDADLEYVVGGKGVGVNNSIIAS